MIFENWPDSKITAGKHLARFPRLRRLRSRGFCALIVFLTALVFASLPAQADHEQRIRFKPPATEVKVSGLLTPKKDEARFVVHALAGRRLIVEVTGPGPLSGEVVSPSGKKEGAPGAGVFFDQKLTETGDYRIRVSEGNRAEKQNVRFVLKTQLR